MITVPKLFTRPCTIRMPKFMMDCCTLVITERFRMVSRFFLSQRQSAFFGHSCGNFFSVYSPMPMPDTNCENTVAPAAPFTPQLQHQHAHEVENDVQHRRHRQKHQRHHRVADGAQQVCEVVVQEGSRDAQKDDDEVRPSSGV